MWQVEVSHKSEMAGPFNRGDTIINKHFTFTLLFISEKLEILGHSRMRTPIVMCVLLRKWRAR